MWLRAHLLIPSIIKRTHICVVLSYIVGQGSTTVQLLALFANHFQDEERLSTAFLMPYNSLSLNHDTHTQAVHSVSVMESTCSICNGANMCPRYPSVCPQTTDQSQPPDMLDKISLPLSFLLSASVL